MNEERGNLQLIDRILSREDRGLVGMEPPANAEAAHRARLPGAMKARARGWPREVEIRRELLLLEEMLRTQAGVHVRQPSHHAMPFRAVQFGQDTGPFALNENTSTDVRIDLFDGNGLSTAGVHVLPDFPLDFGGTAGRMPLEVPDGHRAVITHVCVGMSQAHAALPVTPDFSTNVVWSLRKNGGLIPGLTSRFPTWFYDVGAVLASNPSTIGELPNLLRHPLNLEGGDAITAEITIPTAGNTMNKVAFSSVCGYLYPVRLDEPSVRGTVVD